ncbi:MAG: TetR/AcrR family transcriptional regulator [Gordonia sp. (in: high G+C Gram-positive bacteria)]
MTGPGKREQAKAARRAELLAAAAELMAQRGFAAVRLEDIGARAGVSGPAVYRHFDGKSDLLEALLVEISERLLTGGREVAARPDDPRDVLSALVAFHIEVLVSRPDVIIVHDRDLASLPDDANRRVRSLQRQYVELWVQVLLRVAGRGGESQITEDEARVRVHAGFGLLNSSSRLPAFDARLLRVLLTEMVLAALLVKSD